MSRPGVRTVDPTGGSWRRVATRQTLQDGSVLPAWGVQVAETGQWVGKVHAIGVTPENRAEAHANVGLFAASKAMAAVLKEASQAWAEQFDVAEDEDNSVSGADLVQWFAQWRLRARTALDAAGVP